MALLELSLELFFIVGEMLDEAALYALCLTCRTTNAIFTDMLFRNNIKAEGSSGLYLAVCFLDRFDIADRFLSRYSADINSIYNGEPLLYHAVRLQLEEAVEWLLRHPQLNVNACGVQGESALWLAMRQKCTPIVERLLARPDTDIDSWNIYGQSLLSFVSRCKCTDVLDVLLSKPRVDPNMRDKSGATALASAVVMQNHTMIRKLIQDSRVDVNCLGPDRPAPIIYASRYCRESVMDLLLLSPAIDLNQEDAEGRTALWHAVDNSNYRSVQRLLRKMKYVTNCRHATTTETLIERAVIKECPSVITRILQQQNESEPGSGDEDSVALFFLAVRHGKINIARIFLNRGVSINILDGDGETALHHAARQGDPLMTDFLLQQSEAIVNVRNTSMKTPLHLATEAANLACVNRLLAVPTIHPNPEDVNGRTPFWWATCKQTAPLVRTLLDRHVNYNVPDQWGTTPLHNLVTTKDASGLVRSLLAKPRLELNTVDDNGYTPLARAVAIGEASVVRMLLQKSDIRVNAESIHETGPLFLACRAGRADMVKLLLEQEGANINQKDRTGTSPLHISITMDHFEVAELLLRQGNRLDVNIRFHQNWTPLLLASSRGKRDMVHLLLSHPCIEVNARDIDGRTALWWAAAGGHAEIVTLLCSHSSTKIRTKDNFGQTAYAVAKERRHGSVIAFLRSP
ncbi:hypothetical protein BBP40_002151 [Aspergillus hancockii]|nr:hypothetical protein BBP40_002151 [Aspergillus hancockii]